VVGYDDMPAGATFLPALSTVRQDWQLGGTLLARKVLRLIGHDDAESESLPVELVIRGT
jgi:DNA-binding LacI/PurR family transcriptional regulator